MQGRHQSWYFEDGTDFARPLSVWLRGHTSILLAVQTKHRQLHSSKFEAQVHNMVWIHLCPKMKPKWTCVNCGKVNGQKARGRWQTCLGPWMVHHQCKRHTYNSPFVSLWALPCCQLSCAWVQINACGWICLGHSYQLHEIWCQGTCVAKQQVTEQGEKLTSGPLKSRTGTINSTQFTDSFTDHAYPPGSRKFGSHWYIKLISKICI